MINVNLVTKCFIRNDQDQLLVLRRSVGSRIRPDKWDLAGGKVDQAEDVTVAAIREISEETGLTTSTPRLLSLSTEQEPGYIVTLFYEASYESGNLKLSPEHSDYAWISLDKFKLLDLPDKFHDAYQYLSRGTSVEEKREKVRMRT